jgi:RHS repeat-associated protein
LLISMADPQGRQLKFGYDAQGRLATLTDPSGGLTAYAYDGPSSIVPPGSFPPGNLTSVAYPDGTGRTYWYNEPAYTAGVNLPRALTGIIDENGARYATYRYAGSKAVSTEHAGGVEKYQLSYASACAAAESSVCATRVTDPLGTVHTHTFKTVLGVARPTGASRPGGSGCPASASKIVYEASGNAASRTDFNGNLSCHAHDPARNLETARVEGIAPGGACPADLPAYTPKPNSAERKTATAWHPAYRLPARIDEAGRSTLFDYDVRGNLAGKTILDTATGQARAWAWTYNAAGQMLTEDGPRTDVDDTTAYAYDAGGNLSSVRDAAGHTTQYSDYDAHGRPRRITDPNGRVTTLAYDARGRLTLKTDDGHATAYTHDGVGQLTRLGLPDGAFYTYAYDPAHRLTDIADALGNRLHYTLDAAGHRVQEDAYAADGTLAKTRRRVYDALSRLAQDIGAYNQTTRYQYDANGNLTRQTDRDGHATAYAYDARDRLLSETDALAHATAYRRDALDRLVAVTDPNKLTTAYTYDALGNLARRDSPDTGATLYDYDDVGNTTRRLDANGVETLYAYDSLNRLLLADYPGTADDTAYAYDDPAANAVGRLSSVANGAASLTFGYDKAGRTISTRLDDPAASAPPATIRYQYDAAGRLGSVAYPSGRAASYHRDAAGQVAAVTTAFNGQTATLASGLSYQPFGPLQGLAFGNGLVLNRRFDLDGRLAGQTTGALQDLGYGYDPAGNLAAVADHITPAASQTFGYDALNRLATAAGGYGALGYAYDPAGNRTAETRNGAATPYAYAPGNQHLLSAGGAAGQDYAYDNTGNTIQAGGAAFAYGPGNRLRQATRDGATLADYAYDPLGRRVSKTVNGAATYFVYGPEGQLLAELDSSGNTQAEHVWLDGMPLAVIKEGQIAYVHADPLGAPRLATDQAGTAVWRWGGDPFGAAPADQDPDGDGAPFVYNLRFPGQYFDAETGLHYNMARYYDPATGRYRESDPIGLNGGVNTYAYVGNNPVSYVDPLGLARQKDPNGQECQALSRKIQNIKNDIEKRLGEYEQNPLGLPDKASPGSKPRDSREGHMDLIKDLQARLAELEKKYAEECMDNCPSSNAPSAESLGVGAATIGACLLVPELCIPTIVIGGASAR